MDYFNHITLNTGHSRKSYPSEVEKEIYFILHRLYKDIFNGGADLFDGRYVVKGSQDDSGAVVTVYKAEIDLMPILTTGISRYRKSKLWELLHSSSTAPLKTNAKFPPAAPWVGDRLEVGAMIDTEALTWTAGFSKSIGWIYLAPHKVH
ncbi:hypothetical protein [Paenibacillus sp. UMB4589-SE434]|uniref:hypothetical protein n=1 Tax=Paenibacillus sp. UMB4589-SE434 TaxID=3046314 RepID=UPI00254C89C2|nr:hypothetical protein [Paenibacillus sp. UMB4589-SE434]MDK8182139.1 hypothetical protein [Paenibacillus sp. UMB4589-SE434]